MISIQFFLLKKRIGELEKCRGVVAAKFTASGGGSCTSGHNRHSFRQIDMRTVTATPGVRALLAGQRTGWLRADLGLAAIPCAHRCSACGLAIRSASRFTGGVAAHRSATRAAVGVRSTRFGANNCALGLGAIDGTGLVVDLPALRLTERGSTTRCADLVAHGVVALPGADRGTLRVGGDFHRRNDPLLTSANGGCAASRSCSCGWSGCGGASSRFLTVQDGRSHVRSDDEKFVHVWIFFCLFFSC